MITTVAHSGITVLAAATTSTPSSTDSLLTVGKAAAAVAAIIGLIGLVAKGIRAMLRWARKLGRMSDEILGDGEQNPGWGKRIGNLEEKATSTSDDLGKVAGRLGTVERVLRRVEHEVQPNGGASLADKINRIHTATGADQSGT